MTATPHARAWAETNRLLLMTCETVAVETPASRATSLMLIGSDQKLGSKHSTASPLFGRQISFTSCARIVIKFRRAVRPRRVSDERVEQMGRVRVAPVLVKAKCRYEHAPSARAHLHGEGLILVQPTVKDACQHVVVIRARHILNHEARDCALRLKTQNLREGHTAKRRRLASAHPIKIRHPVAIEIRASARRDFERCVRR